MKTRQIRRQKPTLQTAHEFHKKGSFLTYSPDLELRGKEREDELFRVSNELQNIVKCRFPRTSNLEYAILKSHLILEFTLTQFIRGHSATFVAEDEVGFGFSQKLEIAYLMGFGTNDPLLLPTFKTLNQVRNQIAHKFEFDRALLDEVLQLNHEDYKDYSPKDDRERVRMLRSICSFVSARIAGEMIARYCSQVMLEEEAKAGRKTVS